MNTETWTEINDRHEKETVKMMERQYQQWNAVIRKYEAEADGHDGQKSTEIRAREEAEKDKLRAEFLIEKKELETKQNLEKNDWIARDKEQAQTRGEKQKQDQLEQEKKLQDEKEKKNGQDLQKQIPVEDKKINEWFLKGTAVMMLATDLSDNVKNFMKLREMMSNMNDIKIERVIEGPKEGGISKDDMIQKTIDDFDKEINHAKDENDKGKDADEQRERERKARAEEIMKKFAENRKDISRSR